MSLHGWLCIKKLTPLLLSALTTTGFMQEPHQAGGFGWLVRFLETRFFCVDFKVLELTL